MAEQREPLGEDALDHRRPPEVEAVPDLEQIEVGAVASVAPV